MADMSGQFYRRLEFPCKQSSSNDQSLAVGVKTASTDAVDLNNNDSEVEDGEIRYENFPRSDPRNKHNLHYDKAIIAVDRGDATRSNVVNVVNDLPSLISFLRSVNSNAIRADTTTVFYTHKDDAPANNISSANVVCCLAPLSFFDSIRAKLQECVISVSLDPSKQKNAEAFRSLLSFLSKNDQVGVMAKDKHSRVSFIEPMYLREGHVAARLYYGSLDTLEQARDEALQQSYINAIAEQANASLNPSSSTSSSPAAVAVVSPSLGPDELSNSESEAQGQGQTKTEITLFGDFNFTNMFEKRCCSKEGGDYTQADADANHDQSVAVGVFDCASEAVHTDDLAFDDYLLEEIIDEMNAEAEIGRAHV